MTGPGFADLADSSLKFAAAWDSLALAVVIAALANLVMNFLNLVQPEWTRLRFGTLAATGALLAFACGAMLWSGPFVIEGTGLKNPAQYEAVMLILNKVAFVSLIVLCIAFALSSLSNLRGLFVAPRELKEAVR